MITRIACPQSNLPLDPAERGFVGSIWETEGGLVSHVFGPTGLWKPTDPTIEAGDPA